MQNIDHLEIDGNNLQTFLVVYDKMSISKAAELLGVTQSTVSHTLDKLRKAFADPLFVRYGRGIAPTERAIALRNPVQSVLDNLKSLQDARPFDPTTESMNFTIAANDFQRDLIFPSIQKRARNNGIDLRLHFIPSGVPKPKTLYEAHCDLIVTPQPPEGDNIIQTQLFEDQHVCFYDATVRKPPTTLDQYLACRQAEVAFEDHTSSISLLPSFLAPDKRNVIISVPNFAGLPSFIIGTDLITTELSLMRHSLLKKLDWSPVPFKLKKHKMYAVWHRRDQLNPAHKWLRDQIKNEVSEKILQND